MQPSSPLFRQPLKETAFHPQVQALCQSHEWRRWAGYLVPARYELSHEFEYHAIRNAAALIDVSPLFKYRIDGPDALPLLERVMTRRVSRAAVGQVLYTLWCNDAGQVIEDGTVARLADATYRVTAAEPNLRWLQDNALGLNVQVVDESEGIAALALQGPASRAIMQQLTRAVDNLPYYHLITTTIAGNPVTISRTGYTGDLGYELWLEATGAPEVWQALWQAGAAYGLMAAGMIALDMARIEAGMPMAGVDYTPASHAFSREQTVNPFELGLERLVALDKPEYFVGKTALRALSQVRPGWQRAGLIVEWAALDQTFTRAGIPVQVPHIPWRGSVPLYRAGRQVGYATSIAFSPLLKQVLALALVESPFAAPGSVLEIEWLVDHLRQHLPARVHKLPYFNPPRKTANPAAPGPGGG